MSIEISFFFTSGVFCYIRQRFGISFLHRARSFTCKYINKDFYTSKVFSYVGYDSHVRCSICGIETYEVMYIKPAMLCEIDGTLAVELLRYNDIAVHVINFCCSNNSVECSVSFFVQNKCILWYASGDKAVFHALNLIYSVKAVSVTTYQD